MIGVDGERVTIAVFFNCSINDDRKLFRSIKSLLTKLIVVAKKGSGRREMFPVCENAAAAGHNGFRVESFERRQETHTLITHVVLT